MSDLRRILEERTHRPRFLSVSELPEKVKARVKRFEIKKDKWNKDCLFIILETEDGYTIIQKYPDTTLSHLYEAVEKTGWDQIEKEFLTWKKETAGKTVIPRLYPSKK